MGTQNWHIAPFSIRFSTTEHNTFNLPCLFSSTWAAWPSRWASNWTFLRRFTRSRNIRENKKNKLNCFQTNAPPNSRPLLDGSRMHGALGSLTLTSLAAYAQNRAGTSQEKCRDTFLRTHFCKHFTRGTLNRKCFPTVHASSFVVNINSLDRWRHVLTDIWSHRGDLIVAWFIIWTS